MSAVTWKCYAPNCDCLTHYGGACGSKLDAINAAALSAQARKQRPLYSGLLRYFPKALMAVANCSWVGNEQHNPGEPLHWNRAKSTDEADALMRHLLESGAVDTDGVRHSTKVAWRALALLEKELEAAESSD
jgi:hypothetical protein